MAHRKLRQPFNIAAPAGGLNLRRFRGARPSAAGLVLGVLAVPVLGDLARSRRAAVNGDCTGTALRRMSAALRETQLQWPSGERLTLPFDARERRV
jgi:hypothetical protein